MKKRRVKTAVKEEPRQSRFWPYGWTLFAVLLLLDQWTKWYFVSNYTAGESHKIFPWLWFTYVQNTGTLWGLFSGANANISFLWISVIAFGLLMFFYDQFRTVLEKISYTLILAGLWGNLLDRGVQGFVVDFIDLGWWPVFNIADSAIVVGILIMLLEQFRNPASSPASRKPRQ
jgi:signal peptidase II